MKGDCATYEERIIYANKVVEPSPDLLHWLSKNTSGSVKVYISTHEVASGASDEAILVDDDTNTDVTFIWDTAGVGSDSLTIKSNGATAARAVKPRRILSGRLTSLTVSNGGASAVDMGIARVVVSDTTNTILLEERV